MTNAILLLIRCVTLVALVILIAVGFDNHNNNHKGGGRFA